MPPAGQSRVDGFVAPSDVFCAVGAPAATFAVGAPAATFAAGRNGAGRFLAGPAGRVAALVLLALFLPAAGRGADDLPEPVERIAPGSADASWKALFETLAGQQPLVSTFTETRWFAIRKQPVVLEGQMRFATNLGLSLHYPPPEDRTLIIDRRGILVRDGRGRSREIGGDGRVPGLGAGAALLPVLQFDLATLDRNFEVRGGRDGDRWRLDFLPRDPEVAKTAGTISVRGAGTTVRHIRFGVGEKQRIEIAIEDTRAHALFRPEDLRAYFR